MKKIIMMLAAAAILVALTACGGGTDEGGATPSPTPITTPTPGPADPGPVDPGPGGDPEPPPVELGPPREIRVISWFDAGESLGVRDTPVPGEVADYEIARMQYENRRAVEERYNVRFVSEMVGSYNDFHELFLAGQLAGDSIGDIVYMAPSMIMGVAAGNDAVNLSALDFPGNELHTTRTHMRPGFILGGNIYSVFDQSPVTQPGWFLGMNYRMFQAINIPCPIELYHRGEWTYEAMWSMMEAAVAQGYFGLSGWSRDIANTFIGANGGMVADANFMYAADHPRSLEALEFFDRIISTPGMYFLDPENPDSIWDWHAQSPAFGLDTILFGAGEHWHHATHWPASLGRVEFRAVPFPRHPNAIAEGVTALGMTGLDGGYIIPMGVEDPAFVLQMLQALMAWPGDDVWLLQVTEREELRDEVVWNESCIDMIFHVAANHVFDPGLALNLAIGSDIAPYLHTREHTLAELIEMNRAPYQATLDIFATVFGIR